ncbi:peptidoglycan DD-metalloendopeptidase family protein [Nocardia farcinica]|uniref:peptidoglycan DD-metalloendopeptidase family protein n=1 Tax=Nocardia TaxID=1817 RepID=UPI001894541F|nr:MULTISPECIES: peptidoglycan DD-metalloendopeptidase family protein [Nocardia]MBF6215677.1 peptidoglycan DD-metalloendopeptidase family protein [Nocardia puris]MBF6422352.1 peptidoglycan DD-metalloendopeptidase family protein [Nocardia farcinica]MBF6434053.1 peptidoglycan DD-metalloendopeptidase family protein [Nocardia farcinica]MBF6505109.1 peptidoglycan DD-metalloendopeptidase family protein [Nocardia farcinica]
MTAHRARSALLLTLTAVAAVTLSGCGAPDPVIPRDPCAGDVSSPQVSGPGRLASSGPIRLPVAEGTPVTSGFGPRWGTQHQGIDFGGPMGAPIYAALDGVVVKAGPASGFGHWVIVDSLVDGKPVSTVYGHMYADGIKVREGQQVKAGDHIADIGNDGQSTDAHLHFEYWKGGRLTGGSPIDPAPLLEGAPAPSRGSGADVRLVASSRSLDCLGFGTPGGGDLKEGSVPAELEPWIRKAGSLCPAVRPPLIAAQIEAESGFRRGLTSPAGAQGLTQFMSGTATATNPDDGQPYVIDADGNGVASIWDDGDAIIGQGRYMCAIAHTIEGWIAEGRVQGDLTALTIAAYNAGEGAVLAAGGMPSGGQYSSETQPYVAKIMANMAKYEAAAAAGRFVPKGSGRGVETVAAAREYLGTPYVWGGGGPGGPSGGGFDCSGLTSYAIHAASGGRVTLPRTSEQQWTVGVEVPMDQAQPGDLVFGSWGPSGPGHVGIYMGGGQMVHAPTTGDVVKEAPVQSDMRARRVM